MKVPLSNGDHVIVDDADAPAVAGQKWHAAKRGINTYAVANGPGGTVYMHRFLLGLRDGEVADHVNGNGLDNRRANLRRTDKKGNARNARRASGVSGYRGVWPNGSGWTAFIKVAGKRHYLGQHPTPEAAARAYDDAARQHFGEFATTNFPLLPSPRASSHEPKVSTDA